MDYEIGSIIEYTTFTGGTRTIKITGKEIHNGRPSFDGTVEDGTTVWGYDHQITRVVWK